MRNNLHPVFQAVTAAFRPGGGESPIPERDPSRPELPPCDETCDCTACQLRRLVEALIEENKQLRHDLREARN
jgi:hypothetical protein